MSDDSGFRTMIRCDACDFIAIVSMADPFSTAGCPSTVIDTGAGRELHIDGAAHVACVRVKSSWGDSFDVVPGRRRSRGGGATAPTAG